MKLVLDAGNTRLKWGVFDQTGWQAQGVMAYDALSDWGTALSSYSLESVCLGVNVNSKTIQARIETVLAQVGLTIAWFQSNKTCLGLNNGYDDPQKLGADRWAALLGVRRFCPEGACLVIGAGTALTVDALSSNNDFLGGTITPGFHLMRQALLKGTAGLGVPEGCYAVYPQHTEAAIQTGILNALIGAIDRMAQSFIAENIAFSCLVSGGDAALLVPFLKSYRVEAVPYLVLEGLRNVAETSC